MRTLESTEILDGFQDRLHGALQVFVNGDFVVPGGGRAGLLRPLRLDRRRVPWDVFGPAVASLQALGPQHRGLEHAAGDLIEAGTRHRWLPFADAATLLSGLYRVLDILFEGLPSGPTEQIQVLREFDPAAYQGRGLTTVHRLAGYARRALTPYVWGFYIHGSLSTLDYTAYSDIDDLVIIKRATVLNAELLAQCAAECATASRFFYEHDPLHHHRHYVVTEIDLRRYAPAYLPPEVLRFATAVVGPTEIPLAPRPSGGAHRSIVMHVAEDLARWARPDGRARNMWQLKFLISSILLLPVLYLETRGEYCYKKFSFERARPAFGDAWAAVELASELRRGWSYRPALRDRLLALAVLRSLRNPMLFEHLMRVHARPIPADLRAKLDRIAFYAKVEHLSHATRVLLDASGGAE